MWGFSWRIRLRLRASISFLRAVFSFVSSLIRSIVLGFGRVVPLCPLGLPGKRFSRLVWSPLRVGYMRLEEGVWGFS